jgi:hypothetical protein
MAEDKEPFEALTTTAAQTAEQITKQTHGAMENYFGWLQKTMSTLPWSNTNLNRILLTNATQSWHQRNNWPNSNRLNQIGEF